MTAPAHSFEPVTPFTFVEQAALLLLLAQIAHLKTFCARRNEQGASAIQRRILTILRKRGTTGVAELGRASVSGSHDSEKTMQHALTLFLVVLGTKKTTKFIVAISDGELDVRTLVRWLEANKSSPLRHCAYFFGGTST